jgi:hypothetical protein
MIKPQRPAPQLEQRIAYTQRLQARKPKTLLELHLETIQAAEVIYARTQELRANTARLCARSCS